MAGRTSCPTRCGRTINRAYQPLCGTCVLALPDAARIRLMEAMLVRRSDRAQYRNAIHAAVDTLRRSV